MPWVDLGTITPVLTEERVFDGYDWGYESFRATFIGLGDTRTFKTFCRLVPIHPTLFPDFSEPSRRIWPVAGNTILTIPYPPGFLDEGLALRLFSIRKYVYRRWRGYSNEPAYAVKLEGFNPSGSAQPVAVGIGPDNDQFSLGGIFPTYDD